MLTPVDLVHELGAGVDELGPRGVGIEQVGVGRHEICLGDLDRAFDTALGLRVGRHACRDRDSVVVATWTINGWRTAIPAMWPLDTVRSLSVNQYVGTPPNMRIDPSRQAITVGNDLSH